MGDRAPLVRYGMVAFGCLYSLLYYKLKVANSQVPSCFDLINLITATVSKKKPQLKTAVKVSLDLGETTMTKP
jgi:hypothetical protein